MVRKRKYKPDNSDWILNAKSRLCYGTGATECSPNCMCNMCRMEGKGYYSKEKRREREGNS